MYLFFSLKLVVWQILFCTFELVFVVCHVTQSSDHKNQYLNLTIKLYKTFHYTKETLNQRFFALNLYICRKLAESVVVCHQFKFPPPDVTLWHLPIDTELWLVSISNLLPNRVKPTNQKPGCTCKSHLAMYMQRVLCKKYDFLTA